MPNEKVVVSLDIKAVVEVADTGYLGLKASVQDHIDKAVKDATGWQWFVKQGMTDPEPLRVRVDVRGISIVPRSPE